LLLAGVDTPALFVCAALVALPLGWRRRRPLLVYGLVLAGVVVGMGLDPWLRIGALALAVYTLGNSAQRLRVMLPAILVPATLALMLFGGQLPPVPSPAGPLVLLGAPWLVGWAIAQQRRKTELSQERAARLEQEQAQA